jgi:hypothetical protein
MREEHNECAFPCDVPGCSRIGRRGYFREKDLLNHRRQEHPDAPKYDVAKRELLLGCTEPGCCALLKPSSMRWHIETHRYKERKEERCKEAEKASSQLAQLSQPLWNTAIDFEQQQQAAFNF